MISKVSNITGEVTPRYRSTAPQKRRKGKTPVPGLAPRVSEETRQRLSREAVRHPSFEGWEHAHIKVLIDQRLETFLDKQPYWYGHSDDTRHHAAQRKYKARREKERKAVSSKNKLHQQEHKPEREHNGSSDIRTVCESEPGEAIRTSVQFEEELVTI